MSRYIGIDYGNVRVGIAISDEAENFAFPDSVVGTNDTDIVAVLERVSHGAEVAGIVIGLPLNFAGVETNQTRKARAYGQHIESITRVPVFFENEILTTAAVTKNNAATDAMVDASAAALILQQFLDKRRKK